MIVLLKRLLLFMGIFLYQTATSQSFQNNLVINYGYGTLVAHRNAMTHMVTGNCNYFDAHYTIRTNGTKPSHGLYQYPWFGIGVNFITSGNPIQIGNVGGLFAFGTLRLSKNDDFPFKVKIGAGLGYVQRTFDLETNNQAIAIGSHFNSNMLFRVEKNIPLKSTATRGNELYLSFGLTHFSNAAFKTPNLGLNFITFNAGYQLGWKPHQREATESVAVPKKYEWSVLAGAGAKQQAQPTYPSYFIGQVNFAVERYFNLKSSAFVGLDFVYNKSLSVTVQPTFQQGIFLGYFLNFDRFKFGAGMGVYSFNRTYSEQPLYHKLMIDYNLIKNMFLQLSMRTHWASADFVSLNLRYIFKATE